MGATIRAGLCPEMIATLGLTPLTLVFFLQVSIVGFAANRIAIPLITLVMPLPWRVRRLALPLALPLLMPPLDLSDDGRFELLALDVG